MALTFLSVRVSVCLSISLPVCVCLSLFIISARVCMSLIVHRYNDRVHHRLQRVVGQGTNVIGHRFKEFFIVVGWTLNTTGRQRGFRNQTH